MAKEIKDCSHNHIWVTLGNYRKFPGKLVEIQGCKICDQTRDAEKDIKVEKKLVS